MLCEVSGISRTFTAPGNAPPLVVLRDVSLHLDAGESMAIVGPSGSGKSTLLTIVATLERPDSGTVRIDGQDTASMNDAQLAMLRNRRIGMVFQRHLLLPHLTLLHNVLVPAIPGATRAQRDRTLERAHRLVERVGLSGRLHHHPAALSGGECQRAAVIRALMNGPALLCADEPTGSLDRGSAQALGELLVELNREEKTALLVVTHSEELAARMDRCIRLRDGTLIPDD